MNTLINLLSAYVYTPDGGVNHPVYIMLWVLKVLA